MVQVRGKAGPVIAAALLVLLTAAAYSASVRGDYIFDDNHQILKNVHLRNLGNLPLFFTSPKMGSYFNELKGYRPLTHLSFALSYALSGYNPLGFHAVNLTIHILNSFLVYLAVKMVLRKAGADDTPLTPLFAAGLFALHPIQTNAVSYMSGRAALLAASFTLLSFFAFLKYRSGEGHKYLWAVLSPMFFLLGLLSKENAISLLGIIIVYDLVFGAKERYRRWAYWIPFFAVAVFFLAIRKYVQGFSVISGADYGSLEYFFSECRVYLLYLRLLFLPFNQSGDYNLTVTLPSDPRAILGLLFLFSSAVLLYRLRKKSPAVTFFGAWFLVSLMPESSFIPITDLAEEYRLYLPSAGFFAAAGLLFFRLAGQKKYFRKGLSAAAVILALFCLLAFERNRVWASEVSFWSDAAAKNPASARAHSSLGRALLLKGRYLDAVAELRQCLRLDPRYGQSYGVYNNIGLCLLESDMYEEALDNFQLSIKIYPDFYEGHLNCGRVYNKLGRYPEAVAELLKASSLLPGDPAPHDELAFAYERMGRAGDAMREAETAQRLK